MTVENTLRVSGDLLATTAASIGAALAPVFPAAKVEVSTEVAIEGDDVSIAIYPDRDAPEGGSDFLVGGNLWVGREDARALVERIAGAGVTPPIDVAALTRLGAELATIVARVHSSGAWLAGIRPELVFAAEQRVVLAPRGPGFIAATPLARGMRSYRIPYLSPEELVQGRGGPASDVFSLCATLFFLGTGRHPFGESDQVSGIAARLAVGAPDAWPGGDALGDLLARGLRTTAGERPTAKQLADELSRVT